MIKFLAKVIILFFSIMCTLITVGEFFLEVNTFTELREKINISYECSTYILIGFAIILFVIVFIVSLYRYNKTAKHTADVSEEMHWFFYHLRDDVFDMQQSTVKFNDHKSYYRMVRETCYKLCEYISKFIKEKSNKDFSVCIKMIDIESSANADKGNSKVFTLCRVGKKHDEREKNEKDYISKHGQHLIKDNTDFETIVSNSQYGEVTKSVFACSNLVMLKIMGIIFRDKKYKNSTPKFWKYYMSTIVVPIMIKNEIIKDDDKGFQTVAFLCIDHRFPISKALKNELTGYMKSFGDSLYFIFREIYKRDREIAKKEHYKLSV